MIGSDKIRRYVVTPNRRSEKDPLSLYTAVSITAGGATALGSLCDELLKMLWFKTRVKSRADNPASQLLDLPVYDTD